MVVLGVVDHRAVVRQADHACQAERTTQDVFSQSFQPRRVPRRQVNTVVHAEARVRPGPHLVHRLLVDLAGCHEQLEDLGLPRRQQPVGVDLRQAEEGAVGGERAVGGDRVDVRVEMNQLAKGLNAADHAGHHVFPLQHVAVDFDHGLPGGAGQFAEQAAVIAEAQAEPFGNGEDQLPVGNGLADRVGDRLRREQRAFLMATGT